MKRKNNYSKKRTEPNNTKLPAQLLKEHTRAIGRIRSECHELKTDVASLKKFTWLNNARLVIDLALIAMLLLNIIYAIFIG